MKAAAAKKLTVALLSVTLALFPLAPVYATKPYFKVFGGDVMSGGWFNNGSVCSTVPGSTYQDPNYSSSTTTADKRTGGILSYSKETGGASPAGGSSVEFAAYATGLIEGASGPMYGFYSGGALAGGTNNVNYLSFANSNGGTAPWGGLFEGSVRQSHCIPDYYSKKPATAASIGEIFSTTPSGTYQAQAPAGGTYSLTPAPVLIPPGRSITIYVNGSAYIGGNVQYQLDKVDNIPKFALVVRGSIYIDPSVTRLDGVYIAQPGVSPPSQVLANDDGDIWTCHPKTLTVMSDTYPNTCTNPLVVNGALIAKYVYLLRTNGDISAASTTEDNLAAAAASGNVSEIINYAPTMVLGGPFFNPPSSSSFKVESIVSLPPVF